MREAAAATGDGEAKTKRSAEYASRTAARGGRPSARRSRAISGALKREARSAASEKALARQAKGAARRRSAAAGTRRRIALTLFPPADDTLLPALIPMLEDAFGAAIEITDVSPLPADAHNPARRQYRSTVLLEDLVA